MPSWGLNDKAQFMKSIHYLHNLRCMEFIFIQIDIELKRVSRKILSDRDDNFICHPIRLSLKKILNVERRLTKSITSICVTKVEGNVPISIYFLRINL